MTPEQRAAMALKSIGSSNSGHLPTDYRNFEVVEMEEICVVVHRFEFSLPPWL